MLTKPQSLNIPAIKVTLNGLGINTAIETAQRMGISTITKDNNYGLSLALGAASNTPCYDQCAAAFAAGGLQYEPTTIRQIENKYGEVIYTNNARSKRVQSEQATYLISNILSDNTARARAILCFV